MALTREALLSATEAPTQTVPIPELGKDASVLVRGMNARERTQFEKKFITEHRGKQKRNLDAFREQLCVFCCVDPKLSEADLERLSLVRADIIERIANVAAELSGISEKDIDELGSPSPAPTATSTSSSASPTS
jgi:pyrroline-5-carboxylate reductase